MPRGSVWQDEADGRLRFGVPIEYTNTWVVFTFEGLTYSVAAGQSPNLSNVWFWGQAPIAVTANTASYRVPLSAGLPYTIDAGSFQWPANLLATSTTNNQIQTESGVCTNYLVTSTNAHRLAFGSFRYEPIIAWFDVKAGEINHGWDPMGPEPWTSVGVCRTNEIVELYIHPIEATNLVELVVTTGTSSVNVTPTNFTAQVTGLTIRGLDTPHADAIIEARLRDTGNSLARLHAMVLPWRTVSIGIYRIVDSETDNTTPENTPTDVQVIARLNEVFERQACITFTNAKINPPTEPVPVRYDDGAPAITYQPPYDQAIAGDGRMQFDERAAILAQNSWPGRVKVFLVRRSGLHYLNDNNPSNYVRGFTYPAGHSFVFAETCGITTQEVTFTCAHEVGHSVLLSTRDYTLQDQHDEGPFPDPETQGLMRSGAPINGVPQNVVSPWLWHEDWLQANKAVEEP